MAGKSFLKAWEPVVNWLGRPKERHHRASAQYALSVELAGTEGPSPPVHHGPRGRVSRDVCINGFESPWAPSKRKFRGTHDSMSAKLLQLDLDEFTGCRKDRGEYTIDQLCAQTFSKVRLPGPRRHAILAR